MIKVELRRRLNKDYPKLMISDENDQIVLMTSRGTGTVVHPGRTPNPVGYHTSDWFVDLFKDFDGEVILSSE